MASECEYDKYVYQKPSAKYTGGYSCFGDLNKDKVKEAKCQLERKRKQDAERLKEAQALNYKNYPEMQEARENCRKILQKFGCQKERERLGCANFDLKPYVYMPRNTGFEELQNRVEELEDEVEQLRNR